MAMSPRLLRPLAQPKLLDFAPGAAAAYSLRQLSSSYAGPVVTVRRSSDSAEADFTAGEVSDGTLAAWVGSGDDGFVTTWHDQSGNGKDATQATSTAQPKIIDSGSLVTQAGRPALLFDGSDDTLFLADDVMPSNQPAYSFGVFSATTKTAAQWIFGRAFNAGAYYFSVIASNAATNPSSIRFAIRTSVDVAVFTSAISTGLVTLFSGSYDSSQIVVRRDGAHSATAAASGAISYNANDRAAIGAARSSTTTSLFLEGKISEIIHYNSSQSARVQRIEQDINRHYRIF